MHNIRYLLPACALALAAAAAAQPTDRQDYSAAERLVFMSSQLANVKPPAKLQYAFRKSGSLEPGFDDRVSLDLTRQADGSCCAVKGEFLTGERRMALPDVPAAEANPAILYFLEREVREMKRLTKGAENHFRKRIRMAIYSNAKVRDVDVPYRGRSVRAQEVSFSPFLDDPNRPRYERLAVKEYRFVLATEVPGGVYALRTRVADAGGALLLAEELWIDGAEPDGAPR